VSGTSLLVPPRRRGHEHLDDPSTPDPTRRRSVEEIAHSNVLFGGARAALVALDEVFGRERRPLTLLDVGTGAGDIPERARRVAARREVRLTTIGLDGSAALASSSRARTRLAVCADARALPFPDRSVDLVLCSQLLHHFEGADAARLLAELHRVARLAVVVSDLRRSWIAAAGFWLLSFPLGYHPITRHDGVTSVLRGFTAAELRALVRAAVGVRPVVRRRLGWRLVASWHPEPAP
jgi:SAM-dependent methyltransferase